MIGIRLNTFSQQNHSLEFAPQIQESTCVRALLKAITLYMSQQLLSLKGVSGRLFTVTRGRNHRLYFHFTSFFSFKIHKLIFLTTKISFLGFVFSKSLERPLQPHVKIDQSQLTMQLLLFFLKRMRNMSQIHEKVPWILKKSVARSKYKLNKQDQPQCQAIKTYVTQV